MAEMKKYLDIVALETLVDQIKAEDKKVLDGAKDYADSLATNYDAAGSAQTVQNKLDEEILRAKAAEKVNADAITAIKDGASLDSFADVETELAKYQLVGDYAVNGHKHTKADITDFAHNHEMGEINGLADALAGKEVAGAAAAVEGKLNEYKTSNDAAVGANTTAIAAINNEETGILAQAKSYTDDELTFENGITTVNALGGIAAGQSLDGKSAIEILDMLLFPYVKQTISNVKGSPNGGTFEHGNNQTITSVSATVTKKSKPITKVELLQGSTVLDTKEGDAVKNGGTITFSGLSVAVNSTNVQLTVKAYDENGSTVTGSTGAFTFVYPYYYGVCAAGATIDEALVEGLTKDVSGKGQKAYSYTTDNQCAVIAYPKAHGVLKSALDPNSFENIASFTRSEVSITGLDGKAQTYYVYVSGAFTGSAFKYTFKY